jgi:hypothetical protein
MLSGDERHRVCADTEIHSMLQCAHRFEDAQAHRGASEHEQMAVRTCDQEGQATTEQSSSTCDINVPRPVPQTIGRHGIRKI